MRANSFRLLALVIGLMVTGVLAKLSFPSAASFVGGQKVFPALASKMELAQRANHPAVFLGGGSNVLMGLRAREISDLLQKPVYNLALHDEGGDYRNSLALLEASAKPGDVVVYSSRGFHISPPISSSNAESSDPSNFAWLRSVIHWVSLMDRSILRLLMHTRSSWDRAENFTPLGDFERCLKAKAPLEPQALPESPLNRDRFANDLTDFAKRMNDRGVIVYFFMPDLLVRESDMAAWSLLQRDLTSRVEQLGGKWLTQRSQDIYFVDSSQFCDSPFHPIQTQALIKSELLARQLSRRK